MSRCPSVAKGSARNRELGQHAQALLVGAPVGSGVCWDAPVVVEPDFRLAHVAAGRTKLGQRGRSQTLQLHHVGIAVGDVFLRVHPDRLVHPVQDSPSAISLLFQAVGQVDVSEFAHFHSSKGFPMLNNTVVVYGPQGSGKTRQAQALAAQHGCESIVDEWIEGDVLVPGALHLTHERPSNLPQGVVLVELAAQ